MATAEIAKRNVSDVWLYLLHVSRQTSSFLALRNLFARIAEMGILKWTLLAMAIS